ncbi:MAG: hypothetical protein ACO1QS_12915 [Verrucomicrobiota bacterium]
MDIAKGKGCDLVHTKYWFNVVQICPHEWALSVPEKMLSDVPLNLKPKLVYLPQAKQLSVHLPKLYRILPEMYVRQFFDECRIRLGTSLEYRTNPTGPIQDNKDCAPGIMMTDAEQAGFSMSVGGPIVDKDYILCFTTDFDDERSSIFGSRYAICVHDAYAFWNAIASSLGESVVAAGKIGFCQYQSTRAVDRKHFNPSPKFDPFLFLKPQHDEKQREARMVWTCASVVNTHIDIVSPAAVAVCDLVELA